MSSCLFSWNLSHSGGCSAHVDMHQQAVLGECEVSRAVKGWGGTRMTVSLLIYVVIKDKDDLFIK